MITSKNAPLLERQLLLQLGDRLRSLRLAQGLTASELAERLGTTRNTLRAVEAGDPGPAIGTYLKVMSALGVAGDLALLAGDFQQPPPPTTAGARSRRPVPRVSVQIQVDSSRHRLQDLQSHALHAQAVSKLKQQPELIVRAQDTLESWQATADPRSRPLLIEWDRILKERAWGKALGRSALAQQLRQASPLLAVLSSEEREAVLSQVRELKAGLTLGTDADGAPA
ncbi:transcriptional regulator with XRE-family HTH domain [Inhella inkyongensis]|uniref:Transcriptional regulator with XRE-family HTH domain n=1 Tax=Inhella inkyongensis TaxID=392593 RepID=A0A840S916_9BURK|nr:helix-turn-helix transcriptional regulator [Inhella inkyongensis]MBB5205021.1 transcriptional regulator with XRE-family HTH domain [Inhella inkyongensis]